MPKDKFRPTRPAALIVGQRQPPGNLHCVWIDQ